MSFLNKIKSMFAKKDEQPSEIPSQFIQDLVANLGGISNITGFNNGATSLRYDVKDSSKINVAELEKIGAEKVTIVGPRYVDIKLGERADEVNLEVRKFITYFKKIEASNVKVQEGNLAPKAVQEAAKEEKCPDGTCPSKKVEENVDSVEILGITDAKVVGLETLNDGVFSEKMLGDGIVFDISKKETVDIISPVDGTLEVCFPSKHAYGIVSPNGLSLLIHIGIDTVNLGGIGFETFVNQNDKIQKGQKLATVNVKRILQDNLNPNVILIATNESKFTNFTEVKKVSKTNEVVAVITK